ncbi:MAG: hypothetical protein KDD42_00605 [Bdellovibrionales bacterium]|nr:hypothetical protein [Bdellovibrionales bacterium]
MRIVLWLSVLVAVAAYICGPVMDPDLWWHITVGRWIVAHHTIPSSDLWNLFAAGMPWRAYSWSNEVVFALVDSYLGDRGLLLLKFALALALAGSLFYCLSKLSQDWFFGSLLGIFSTTACYNHFTLRPQSLVWIFFIWLIFVSERIVQNGFSARRVATLLLIMCFWANTHITTILGIAICMIWLFQRNDWKRAIWGGLICVCGTLITPYYGGEWLTFFSKTGHPFAHQAIVEFQPAHIMQHSTGFWVIIAVFLGAVVHDRPKLLPFPMLAAAAAFSLAGLAIVKFLPIAVILLAALVAVSWSQLEGKQAGLKNIIEAIDRLRERALSLPLEGLAFVFLCIAAVNFFPLWSHPINRAVVPVSALDFLMEKSLPFPLLNDFGRGGYVMYRLSDSKGELQHKVTIDGRTNVNPPEVWEKSQASFRGRQNWREYIDMTKANSILWPSESPLTAILKATGEWCRVFESGTEDRGFSIFIKSELLEQRSDLTSDNCERQPVV